MYCGIDNVDNATICVDNATICADNACELQTVLAADKPFKY